MHAKAPHHVTSLHTHYGHSVNTSSNPEAPKEDASLSNKMSELRTSSSQGQDQREIKSNAVFKNMTVCRKMTAASRSYKCDTAFSFATEKSECSEAILPILQLPLVEAALPVPSAIFIEMLNESMMSTIIFSRRITARSVAGFSRL